MADKGFDILYEFRKKGAILNIPPYENPGQLQFSQEEVEKTKRIAEVLNHVERLIGRIKQHHILDGNLPLTLHYLADNLIHVCAYLTLFQNPIIAQFDEDRLARGGLCDAVNKIYEETFVSTIT